MNKMAQDTADGCLYSMGCAFLFVAFCVIFAMALMIATRGG